MAGFTFFNASLLPLFTRGITTGINPEATAYAVRGNLLFDSDRRSISLKKAASPMPKCVALIKTTTIKPAVLNLRIANTEITAIAI
jgi:hypothetical protein